MTAIVLAVALLLAGPSVLDAFEGTGSIDAALVHLVLALVGSAIAGQVVRAVVRGYQDQVAQAEAAGEGLVEGADAAGRRRDDR